MRETLLDAAEGADVAGSSPPLPYLDLIARVRERPPLPLAATTSRGEYSMVKAAAAAGHLDRTARHNGDHSQAIRRAGADIIITYWASEAAEWLT